MKSTQEHPRTRRSLGIGALAAHYGLATHVLRHWESVGLLTPRRDAAGRRVYGEQDLLRVGAILCAKDAGLSLADIHTVTTARAGAERHALLAARRTALQEEIALLTAQLALVECGLDCDHEDLLTCPTFQSVVAERARAGRTFEPGARHRS
ncbi:MerR family transcriptional regulator [Streptomyces sp. NPDC050418]|uniref:MerR family transcriptional regulator n=1 Tax=Streptomyces sp. NPDC050418 TaxID=3365612 RepID=UPI0037928777